MYMYMHIHSHTYTYIPPRFQPQHSSTLFVRAAHLSGAYLCSVVPGIAMHMSSSILSEEELFVSTEQFLTVVASVLVVISTAGIGMLIFMDHRFGWTSAGPCLMGGGHELGGYAHRQEEMEE